MWKLAQGVLSSVVGTAEPEYGPEYIHPVGFDLKPDDKLYQFTTTDDLKFKTPNHTNVETQTFYFNDSKYYGFAQIIHSNVIGLHTTAQFTFKFFDKLTPSNYIWTSTKLENFKIEGTNFFADGLKIYLINEDEYIFQSYVNPESYVDLKIKKLGQGIKFGKDGTTYYGNNINEPWGSMRHIFWPRCEVNGKIIIGEKSSTISETNEEEFSNSYSNGYDNDGNYKFTNIDTNIVKNYDESNCKIIELINGNTMYVMALQGMKPHHAAATWNFLNYISNNYSVVLMEFTTPASYAKTKVSVGIVVDNKGEILIGSMDNEVNHLNPEKDEVGWPVPKSIEFIIKDKNNNNKVIVNGDLKNLSERVDVMSELPQFVKNIVSGVAGTKPYIYQFSNDLNFKFFKNENELIHDEKGYGYSEATFITEI